MEIGGSCHVLPPHEQVPALVEEACRYVNESEEDPIVRAAYILWRLCWIHPFEDGNGRTARVVAYLVISVGLTLEIPGAYPLPVRIKCAPLEYVRALEAADAAIAAGRLDVSRMVRLLAFYLAAQIRDDPPGLPPWA